MKKFSLFLLLLVLTDLAYGQNNAWNSLTPLRSTRADVEKIFGKPKESKAYETPSGTFSVNYSDAKCDEGWNVSKDTVLSLSVSPKSEIGKSFEELKLDERKFLSSVDDAFFGSWTNAEEGFQYYFSNVRKELISITYIPKKSDNIRRCDGFPPFAPEAQYFTMDKYSLHNKFLSEEESIVRLYSISDTIIANAVNDENSRAYVLVYFDNKFSLKNYRAGINKLKNFVFNWRKAPVEKIMFIEGGLREEAEIEFYILPKELSPPAPAPTLPSPQFRKK
jgi:hypothetical protein